MQENKIKKEHKRIVPRISPLSEIDNLSWLPVEREL